jgi:hypothetical protein
LAPRIEILQLGFKVAPALRAHDIGLVDHATRQWRKVERESGGGNEAQKQGRRCEAHKAKAIHLSFPDCFTSRFDACPQKRRHV